MITLANGPVDPLQSCVEALGPAYITDAWLCRRLPAIVAAHGFVDEHVRSHGLVQIDDPDYMLSIADRGADALAAAGTIGAPLADALNSEARHRVASKAFLCRENAVRLRFGTCLTPLGRDRSAFVRQATRPISALTPWCSASCGTPIIVASGADRTAMRGRRYRWYTK
jgi:hypothetical protein